MKQNEDTVKGFWLAISGYLLWGIFPIYFHLVRDVSALEVLSHRIIWSMVLLLAIGVFLGKRKKWHDLIKSRKTLVPCIFSALLLSVNWLIYIWAVANQMVLEGSLGYFINPLISVLMAVVVLGERLNKFQLTAIVFALSGVLFMILKVGYVPWVALSLALTFATYGLIHKRYSIDAFAGLTLETILCVPLAIAFMAYLFSVEQQAFLATSWRTDALLLAAGIITTLPLLLFLASLSNLRLSTVGLLQYIVPSLHFFVAIYILNEPLSDDKLITFCLIWFGLLIFTYDIVRQRRLKNRLQK